MQPPSLVEYAEAAKHRLAINVEGQRNEHYPGNNGCRQARAEQALRRQAEATQNQPDREPIIQCDRADTDDQDGKRL